MRNVKPGWVGVGLAVALLLALLLAGTTATAGTRSKKGDLVVLEHDRWLDTLKGAVKNFSKSPARDVTVIVKFLDQRKRPLGTQRVSVGDLRSGDQSAFTLAIAEKNRPAKSYQFEVHAIWP
jgi:hypothetical protein